MKTILAASVCLLPLAQEPVHETPGERILEVIRQAGERIPLDGAILVADSGEVVFEDAFGLANRVWEIENTPSTRFLIGSVAKQFTAILIMQLAEAGTLDLDATVADYLPDALGEVGTKVSLHQLLTHTSGIRDYYDRDFFENHKDRFYSHQQFVRKFIVGDLSFEPGSRSAYSSSNYYLLGLIIEEVTGLDFDAVLQKNILDPLGMNDSGVDKFSTVDAELASGYIHNKLGYQMPPFEIPESSAFAAGDMYSTVRDILRFHTALDSGELLTAESMLAIYEPWAPSSFTQGMSFGFGCVVGQRKIPAPGQERLVHQMAGSTATGFTAVITRMPEDGHLVAILTNTGPGYFNDSLHALTAKILDILYSDDRGPDRPSANPDR